MGHAGRDERRPIEPNQVDNLGPTSAEQVFPPEKGVGKAGHDVRSRRLCRCRVILADDRVASGSRAGVGSGRPGAGKCLVPDFPVRRGEPVVGDRALEALEIDVFTVLAEDHRRVGPIDDPAGE